MFLTKKVPSVMPFAFNVVELYVVAIYERPWTRAKDICRALEYDAKTSKSVKNHCNKEHFAHEYQLAGLVLKPVNWPGDL